VTLATAGRISADTPDSSPVSEGTGGFRHEIKSRQTGALFVLSVMAVNVASILGSVFAFRWIDPASMGVWHTLLLASSYATIVRLGLVNGMGRELPFALGRGDVERAQRIAATSLAYTVASSAFVALAFLVALLPMHRAGRAWQVALPAMGIASAANLYLAYVLAMFRSESDFGRLTRIHVFQAVTCLFLPPMIAMFGFAGLCLHTLVQSVVVAAVAHAARPLRVPWRFEPWLAGELLLTGLPLFGAAYLQTLAAGFDRVILLQRGNVATVGYYAPAAAILAALAIVPGAVSTYVYPRMSFALGGGCRETVLRRMAVKAALASAMASLPLVVVGWLAAPVVIQHYFAQYAPSIPAVRWSLVAGLFWSVSPAAQVLGSVKAWRSLGIFIAFLVAARWSLPFLLSRSAEPLSGVARGNAWAAAATCILSFILVSRVRSPAPVEAEA
jgi:O-antigen/teichoic acid export membrane protein